MNGEKGKHMIPDGANQHPRLGAITAGGVLRWCWLGAALCVVIGGSASGQTTPPAGSPKSISAPNETPVQAAAPGGVQQAPSGNRSAPSAPEAPISAGTGMAAPASIPATVAAPPLGGPDARAEPEQVSASASLLPRDLSPWGMFVSAHIVVKVVMIGLAVASVLTWTVAFAKGLELVAAKRAVRRALRTLTHANSLAEAGAQLAGGQSLAAPVRAALTEIRISADVSDREGIKERVASRLERVEAGAGRRMTRGTGVLATVGAIAPFVGLFGTVWGIMNSFIGISKQHTTNLAVVAPGIAEALLATALGLAAAIPAVVIYNVFSRSIAQYRALYADGTAEILQLVSRDLDRAQKPLPLKGRSTAALSAAE
jgi:biopolymer transport protein ExbB